jgi:uncharacterized protein YihD (DUF1040 family)
MLLDKAIKQLPKDNYNDSFFKLIYYTMQELATESLYICNLESEDTEILYYILKLVDLGLGNDVSGMKAC